MIKEAMYESSTQADRGQAVAYFRDGPWHHPLAPMELPKETRPADDTGSQGRLFLRPWVVSCGRGQSRDAATRGRQASLEWDVGYRVV